MTKRVNLVGGITVKSKTADLLLLGVAMIWGGGFPAVGVALQNGIGPSQLIAIRFIVAALGMIIIFFRSLRQLTRTELVGGMLAGGCLFIGFAFQTIGMQYTTASKNAFITSAYVLLVPLLGLVFLKKRMGWLQWIGIGLMIMGISILSLENDLTFNLGDSLTLVCAVGFALQILVTGLYAPYCNAYCFNTIQMVTVALISMIWSAWTEPWVSIDASSLIAILYLGGLSTLVAFLIQTVAQRYTSEAKVGLILSSESLFGAILSVLILHEPITIRLLIGGLVIFSAILMSEVNIQNLPWLKRM